MTRGKLRQDCKPLLRVGRAKALAAGLRQSILPRMTQTARSPVLPAALLTGAGAIPFVGLVIAMAVAEPPTNATMALWLQTYAAVILSFLGGIRWGLEVARPAPSGTVLGLSVLPALAGWAILPSAIILLPGPGWFLAYAGLFALQLGWDLVSVRVPGWFKPVRAGVSAVVIASLAGAWAVQAFGL